MSYISIRGKEGRKEEETKFTFVTAALLALYQTNPGRGLVAPIEAILMMEPPSPCLMNWGMMVCAELKTDLTFTEKTLSNSSSVTSSVG